MKVALVLDNFDPQAGGLEKWTVGLAGFLLDRGHDVHVVAFEHANHGLAVGMTVLPPAWGIWPRAAAVAAALRGIEADVVHDTGLSFSGDVYHPQTGSRLLSQARLIASQPFSRRLRSAISPVSIRWRRDMGRLERQQVREAREIVAVSRLVAKHLCLQHGLEEDRLTLIPNGVDVAWFAPACLAPLRQAGRSRLGAGHSVVFLASAFNMHLKGVDTAIRALVLLAGEGADAMLAVAGARADPFWRRLAVDRGVGDRVVFLGPVADMRPMFASADAVVHATRWDAGSLSTLEGQASGLPVITTAMNGSADAIVDGETGFVLPDPEDTIALAGRMRLLLDAGVRQRMGEAARAAAPGFDTRVNLAAVEQVLLAAAANRSRSNVIK